MSNDDQEHNLRIIDFAMQMKDIHSITNIFRYNIDSIRYKNQLGETLLHLAVKYNFTAIVYSLIKNGLKVDSPDDCQRTPLHFAVTLKNLDMMKILLKHQANPNIENLYGKSPLHLAVNFGDTQVIKLLLKNGAKVTKSSSTTGQTSLHIALRNESFDTFKLLLDYHRSNHEINVPDAYGETLLHSSIRQNSESSTKLLIDRGANVNFLNTDDETPLHLAIHRRNFNICKLLLEHHADGNVKNKYGENPIHLAVRYKDVKLVELLLSFNVEVDNALHVAVDYYNREVVELLTTSVNIDVDAKNSRELTPFHMAIKLKCLDAARQLLKLGKVDVNVVAQGKFVRDCESFTPLHTAIVQKDFESVKFLLDNGAWLRPDDWEIFLAVEFGCVRIVDLLLQFGANVNADALFYAAMKSRDIEKIKLLLNRSGDTSKVNEIGSDDHESALHLAVKAKDEKFVKFLLNVGIDVNLLDGNGATALCLAQGIIANLIVARVALMKVVGSFVCKRNESLIETVREFTLYFDECANELARIRSTRYGDVSLIEFLRGDTRLWGRYVRRGIFDARIDENCYPIYWDKLLENVEKGVKRWNSIRRAKDILCEFLSFQALYDVLDDVLDNFSDDELDAFVSYSKLELQS